MHELTRRQQQIYEYLSAQAQQSNYPTSIDALCEALQLSSRGSMHKHIQALIKAGLIAPLDKKQRGIRILSKQEDESCLPLLGTIAAGRPIEAIHDAQHVEVPIALRTRRPCYVLKVKGDSMQDDHILDGDQVIVEERNEARNGEIVVALIDGQDTTLKRIEQHPDRVILHPANARYKPMQYAPDRISIQGIVVGLLRSYR